MTALLEVENLGTWFYTRQGIVKAVDGVQFQVASWANRAAARARRRSA
jgi:peptide/nickel transport system ATP-binding protein